MFCPKCGNILPDNAKFCTSCGTKVSEGSKVNADCDHPHTGIPYENQQNRSASSQYTMMSVVPRLTFQEALRNFYDNILNFNGRARRSEYWYVVLFFSLVEILLDVVFGGTPGVFALAIWVVQIPLTVRRLHDVGKKGTFYLVNLIPIIGSILFLVQLIKDSEMRTNEFGPCPKIG